LARLANDVKPHPDDLHPFVFDYLFTLPVQASFLLAGVLIQWQAQSFGFVDLLKALDKSTQN